jgi:hypothetical protein
MIDCRLMPNQVAPQIGVGWNELLGVARQPLTKRN